MNRIILKSKVSSDGVLHLHLPIGKADADKEVQVTVEPVVLALGGNGLGLVASDLLNSGLIGMWADRTDIGDGREFARRLREQAQSRRHEA